ncbi:MAG: hypothetical protein ABFD89_00885 [Bryobacteraceae bacterium]
MKAQSTRPGGRHAMHERDMSEPEAAIPIEPSMRDDSRNVPRGGPIYELLGYRTAEQAAEWLWERLKQAE